MQNQEKVVRAWPKTFFLCLVLYCPRTVISSLFLTDLKYSRVMILSVSNQKMHEQKLYGRPIEIAGSANQ